MDRPVIFLVADDARVLDALAGDLGSRFGADYRVVAERSPVAALAALAPMAAAATDVALVIAARPMAGMGGLELLLRAHELHPGAKRVLLEHRGEWTSGEPIVRGMTLGQLDYVLFHPWKPIEQNLYLPVSDFLAGWETSRAPGVEAIRVVGPTWAASSHELRDTLARAGIPYGFYPDDSVGGRRLLEESGEDGTRLPVVVFRRGMVLVDPSHTELVEALGLQTRPAAGGCDVLIVGAGPAGLAVAVYAASEGLQTRVLEPSIPGGQAGTSSLIRNYLGFPHGLSGEDLTWRMFQQAWLFGAEPRTDWLDGIVERDQGGYVLTGRDLVGSGWPLERAPMPLETSLPGVFAAGDVRCRSVKRVASAVGEGANAVQLVHEYLAP